MPSGLWKMLDAVILPDTIGQSDLWKIEAGLQLSKEKVAEYHPVNELLKIKQGIESGLTPEEIAAALYGRTIDEIHESLERLQLIDSFLTFFDRSKPNNYGLIKKFGLHEYFINVQKSILASAGKEGIGKRAIQKRLKYTFALMRAQILAKDTQVKGISHFAIRNLRKVYASPRAHLTYVEPFKDVKDIRDVEPETVIEAYWSAKEVVDLEAQQDRPIKLIERAIKALESIDTTTDHFRQEDVKSSLDKLIDVVNNLVNKLK
jgi:hypothetical protein